MTFHGKGEWEELLFERLIKRLLRNSINQKKCIGSLWNGEIVKKIKTASLAN